MRNIPVIHEDEWLCIIDKPSGLLTIPDPGRQSLCVTDILNNALKEKQVSWRLHPCHRLDRETSGLLIYAKGKSVEQKMISAFRDRLVGKQYIAFVHGKLSPSQGAISSAIEGKSALTKYRVIQEKSNYSVVEISPVTGRTNQIRIHFKHIQHPLVGEDKFAYRKDFVLRAKRVCLHAQHLEFKHPQTAKMIVVKSSLPEDMQKFLDDHQS